MMEIQSESWTTEAMIIRYKSREIHTKAHYISHTSHSHSNENQNHITLPSQKNCKITHNYSYLLYCNLLWAIKHALTHQSPLNSSNPQPHLLFHSQTSKWTQITTHPHSPTPLTQTTIPQHTAILFHIPQPYSTQKHANSKTVDSRLTLTPSIH